MGRWGFHEKAEDPILIHGGGGFPIAMVPPMEDRGI